MLPLLKPLPRRFFSSTALPPWPIASSFPPRPVPTLLASESTSFVSRSPFHGRVSRRHGAAHAQSPGISSQQQQQQQRTIPTSIALPPYARGDQPNGYPEPQIHSAASIASMRAASSVAAQVLAACGALMVPGVSGDDVDAFVHTATLSRGAYPSPLGYMGFPKSVCVSVNEVVCHGIPSSALFRAGDIVSVDVSVFLNGVHGDTCRTWIVGGDAAGDARARALVATTKSATDEAIKHMGPGVPISRVGDIIAPIAAKGEFTVVESFAGHGIGETFHTQPIVHHTPNNSPYVLRAGMCFTIEPMLAEGGGGVTMWPDGWGVVTVDNGRAAQFEHLLLVTDHGVDVLTKYE
jgi:methionyl aminopeptidase